ncbi:MAG: inverse autotransporter beta domain-containing protein [Kiritimatiellae bacterium]|nr:inverse autotransporter beta domain-containing protein [Kiritimatiellia bacterium]
MGQGFDWTGCEDELAMTPPPGLLTIGGGVGDEKVEGQVDLFLPLEQVGENGILFVDPRASFNDDSDEGLNVGLGYRHLFPFRNLILGANLYYDSRWTAAENRFQQVGVGFEALSEWVDFRANYYLPEDKTAFAGTDEERTRLGTGSRVSYSTPYAVGNAIRQTRTDSEVDIYQVDRFDVFEGTMQGFDLELGVKLPLPAEKVEARVFGGHYCFDPNVGGEIRRGFRGRLELRALPGLLVDAQVFDDEQRDAAGYFVGARLQVPFELSRVSAGKNPFAAARAAFKSRPGRFQARLAENVMRDPDIRLAQRRELTGSSVVEETTASRSRPYTLLEQVVFVDNASGAASGAGTAESPVDTVQGGVNKAFGANNVYVYAGAGPYTENVTVNKDVNLIGQGYAVQGYGGKRFGGDRYAVVNGGGSAPALTIDGGAGAGAVTVKGFDLASHDGAGTAHDAVSATDVPRLQMEQNIFRDADCGVRVTARAGATVSVDLQNNTFQDTVDDGLNILAQGTLDAFVSANSAAGCGGDGFYVRAEGNGAATLTVAGNLLTGCGEDGIDFYMKDDGRIAAVVIGNAVAGCGDQGLEADAIDNGVFRARFEANTVAGCGAQGIDLGSDLSAEMDVGVLGNTLLGNNLTGGTAGFEAMTEWLSDMCLKLELNVSDTGYFFDPNGASTLGVEPLRGNTGAMSADGIVTEVGEGTCEYP